MNMVNTVKERVSNYFQSFAEMLHLNLKRIFYGIILILSLVPLAYALFLMLNAAKEGLSVMGVMQQRPTIAILSIVAGLDIMSGYSLWMARKRVLSNRRLYQLVLVSVLVTQLLVSNFLVAGAALVGLLFSRQIGATKLLAHKSSVAVPISLLSLGYVFCTVMMVTVMTR
ncbi:hypothetical protein [Lacticaseibacillus paracasei]|uniref:hypothetical protein n=1 Tax=Lacticaseibacillus paracasei TaxID=1597 RepID=UPI00124B9603|nr:hypothetical protein [Lacticaseibacillus paracasei]KAB1964925.1 hypothetical protein F8272_09365 [Lacticaseibacillus paracasei]MCT3332069.1 hypothetical protein [Lacticaseibacillus paracasei]